MNKEYKLIMKDSKEKLIFINALNMVISAASRRQIDPQLSGMAAYVTADPKKVRVAKGLIDRIKQPGVAALSLNQAEVSALHSAVQDLQGIVAATDDDPYCMILGCMQDQLISYLTDVHKLYERTPECHKIFD